MGTARNRGEHGGAPPFCPGKGTLQFSHSASVGHKPPNSESFNRH